MPNTFSVTPRNRAKKNSLEQRLVLIVAASIFSLTSGCTGKTESTLTIQPLQTPAGPDSAEPHLSRGLEGQVVLSWLEREEEGVALRFATLGSGSWQDGKTVARGANWFVNWADFPSVTPVTENVWAAHWLVRRPGGTYSYDVAIAHSLDGGQTWSDPVTPHDDGTPTEHGFVSLFPATTPTGVETGALWLDGRNMGEGGHGDSHTSPATAGMTLRSAILNSDGKVTESRLVDSLVCDCCQTDVAITSQGPVAVYRDRSPDEIRDIYIARLEDGEWHPGVPVASDGWKIAGCPVNGPAIAAVENKVAVAWYTAADEAAVVKLALSNDSGKSFLKPVVIDDVAPLGRVDVEILDEGDTVVSWMRTADSNTSEVCVRVVSAAGVAGPTHILAQTSNARASGFPQMIRHNADLVFVWTSVSGASSSIRSARLSNFSKQALAQTP